MRKNCVKKEEKKEKQTKKMAHAENNEKKKDNKDVKKSRRIFPKGNYYFNAFAQKRDTKRNDKSRYTRDFLKIQK